MCYHFSLKSAKRTIELRFKTSPIADEIYFPSHHLNGFNRPRLLGITHPQTIQTFQWGLIPSFVATNEEINKIALKTLNAKSETVFEKKSFADAVLHQRCLIIADAFYEWQHIKTKKQAFRIAFPHNQPFAFAGIYTTYTLPGSNNPLKTCSILTCQAQGLMRDIHNTKLRMPLILPQSAEQLFLKPDTDKQTLADIFHQPEYQSLQATPVNHQFQEIKQDLGYQIGFDF